MSEASDALLLGYRTRRDKTGEPLTYRYGTAAAPGSVEVTAVVNRDPFEKKQNNSPDFGPQDVSTIEVELATMGAVVPAAGGSFLDQFTHVHRVKSVKRLGATAVCNCEVHG